MSRDKSFCPERSRYKLKIYLSAGGSKTYYSFLFSDKKDPQKSLNGLVNRMLSKHKGEFNSALLYDNKTKKELCRFDQNGQIITN